MAWAAGEQRLPKMRLHGLRHTQAMLARRGDRVLLRDSSKCAPGIDPGQPRPPEPRRRLSSDSRRRLRSGRWRPRLSSVDHPVSEEQAAGRAGGRSGAVDTARRPVCRTGHKGSEESTVCRQRHITGERRAPAACPHRGTTDRPGARRTVAAASGTATVGAVVGGMSAATSRSVCLARIRPVGVGTSRQVPDEIVSAAGFA
jgi:hypothetical protein